MAPIDDKDPNILDTDQELTVLVHQLVPYSCNPYG